MWQQLCTQRHNDESPVRHRDDKIELRFGPRYPEALYRNLSPLRYDEPFYYGLFRNHTVILMFERVGGVRFTHSPSGGGGKKKKQTPPPPRHIYYICAQKKKKKKRHIPPPPPHPPSTPPPPNIPH